MPSRSARKPRRERPRWKIVMALKARTSASGPPSAASCASSWSEATNQRRNSRPVASGGWPFTWTAAMRALLTWKTPIRSPRATRVPSGSRRARRLPPALDEAPVHQHLDFGVARERGLEIPRELWVVAGDEKQMSGHRVLRCTGTALTRAACDRASLDEPTPQTLLQWKLVPITEKQRRRLDDHEHRDHDGPKGGPRAHFPSQVKAEASDGAEKRGMDQIEGEAGHAQPAEPGPAQVSHEKPAAIGQTEDEKNRAGHIEQPSPQWPSRVRPGHGASDDQPETRGLRQAGTSSEFLSRRRQKDAGGEDTHEKLHKPRGSEPGNEIEPSLVGSAVPEEQSEAARITYGHNHRHPTTAVPQREEHDHRGKEIKEPLAADAP